MLGARNPVFECYHAVFDDSEESICKRNLYLCGELYTVSALSVCVFLPCFFNVEKRTMLLK